MTSLGRPSVRLKLLSVLVGAVALPMLLILLAEGCSSLLLLGLALWQGEDTAPFQGRWHARYDEELGWANLPSADFPDMYGPGVPLRIDAEGFRQTRQDGDRSGAIKLRVICSGDSFTFGNGVADDRTWCAVLSAMDHRLETVNMGQAGYGSDQVYLWYKRDGRRLEHGVHFFAYITDDLFRMRQSSFLGLSKPVLAIQGDSLVVRNTPVPRWEKRTRWFWRSVRLRHHSSTGQLFVWLGDSLLARPDRPTRTSFRKAAADSVTWEEFRLIIRDLARMDREKQSTLILVHLPVAEDYRQDQSDRWRERVQAASEEADFVFVDLVRELRRLPADSAAQMFIGRKLSWYPDPDAVGHYTVIGHQWVAEQLYARLLAIPAVAAQLK